MASRPELSASYFERFEIPDYRFKTQTIVAPQNGSSLASQISLPAAEVLDSEESFEAFVDEMATQIKGPFTLEEFREVWPECSRDLAGIVSRSKAITCEDLINDIAVHLFPFSNLFREVEEELFEGKQFKTTVGAKNWLNEKAALYGRLAKRWNQMYGITNGRLIYIAFKCLPQAVRLVMETEDYYLWTIDELFQRAERAEFRIRGIEGKLPQWN